MFMDLNLPLLWHLLFYTVFYVLLPRHWPLRSMRAGHTRTYYQRSMSGAYNKDLHILGDKENDKLAEEHQNKL